MSQTIYFYEYLLIGTYQIFLQIIIQNYLKNFEPQFFFKFYKSYKMYYLHKQFFFFLNIFLFEFYLEDTQ